MAVPKCIGFVGWRGMVGKIILRRLLSSDQPKFKAILFSSSRLGSIVIQSTQYQIRRTDQLKLLVKCFMILASQGSLLTGELLTKLRKGNWKGYWIDAASFLRNKKSAVIVLDPTNHQILREEVGLGIKSFVGGNCTVSLLLMAVGDAFRRGLVKKLLVTTFQSVSGAGIKAVSNFLERAGNKNPNLDVEVALDNTERAGNCSLSSVTPWIDSNTRKFGTTKEELKGMLELPKLLRGHISKVAFSSICVRVGVLRCHSQSIFLRLEDEHPTISWLSDALQSSHRWLKLIPNLKSPTVRFLIPTQVSRTFAVLVGRIKRATAHFISAFTIGDQLFWGAAEPIVRIVKIICSTRTSLEGVAHQN
ncbi:aspartate-semialdehyde dehydrogenase [Candidatus Tremblaya phenacola PAVE]|nr:aspartate-semialdehyde dehydrogenase [Candidatus Tremblaya phenacola PAVE]